MKKVAVLLAEGFETIEALTSSRYFKKGRCYLYIPLELMKSEVTTSHSITIKADKVLNDEIYRL